MDRAFATMIRKDNSPKNKLQETFQLLMSIERKRRLSTVKGIKICRLNFRRFHRVLGPFLGISRQLPVTDNIPIGHQTKWTAFLFFRCFLCFVFFFQLGPRFHCSDFIFNIWLGPEKLRDFKFGKRAPGVG